MAADVTRNPPTLNAITLLQSMVSATVRYVITAEKTTRDPNLNLVSLRYPKIFEEKLMGVDICDAVVSKNDANLAEKWQCLPLQIYL